MQFKWLRRENQNKFVVLFERIYLQKIIVKLTYVLIIIQKKIKQNNFLNRRLCISFVFSCKYYFPIQHMKCVRQWTPIEMSDDNGILFLPDQIRWWCVGGKEENIDCKKSI